MSRTAPDPPARWLDPSPATEAGAPLTPQQIEAWRAQGFALVDGIVPDALLERVHADAVERFPEPGSRESEAITDFGSAGQLQFPSTSDAFNEITLHPRVLSAVAQLLDAEVGSVRLTQSDLWPKYGRKTRSPDAFDNDDQRIHVDYPNHSLVHPPRWHEPEAVEIILYLSDVQDCGGATALVPRTGADDPAYRYPIVATPGVGALEWINDRHSAEAYLCENQPDVARFRAEHLYPREARARYRFGTCLLYRHDTWHRGTPLRPGTRRFAQNLTFRRSTSEWVSVLQPGWAWAMYRRGQGMERLIARLSVEQRCALGFPAPGHPYWTPDTIAAVRARYGPLGMDVRPYERETA